MSEITIIRTHSLSLAKAKALVTKAAVGLAAEYSLASEWDGDTLRFHRAGVDGEIAVTESDIRLDAKLGMLLRPMRGRLVDYIESEFDTALARASAKAKKPKKPKAAKKRTGSRDS